MRSKGKNKEHDLPTLVSVLLLSLIWNMTLTAISFLSTSLPFLSLSSAEKATQPHALINGSPGKEGARAVCRVPLLPFPSTLRMLSKTTQRKSRALLMYPLPKMKLKESKETCSGVGKTRYLCKGPSQEQQWCIWKSQKKSYDQRMGSMDKDSNRIKSHCVGYVVFFIWIKIFKYCSFLYFWNK